MKPIKQAAILHNGIVHTGKRHKDIAMSIADKIGSRKGATEGFITSQGLFVDRKEAAKIAYMSGQIKEPVEKLKSEHIY